MSRSLFGSPIVGVGSRGVAASLCLLAAPSRPPSLLVSSSSLTAPTSTVLSALAEQRRHKAKRIRIANRKKVELFVGTRFHLPTRLRTAAPDIAAEWDYDRNPGHEYPEIIGIGHMAPVWWKCGTCGHAYEMSVEKRVVRGGGCERCARAAAVDGEAAARAESVAAGDRVPPSTSDGEYISRRMTGGEDDTRNDSSTARTTLPAGELLEGERNPAMRSKRSTLMNTRTKY